MKYGREIVESSLQRYMPGESSGCMPRSYRLAPIPHGMRGRRDSGKSLVTFALWGCRRVFHVELHAVLFPHQQQLRQEQDKGASTALRLIKTSLLLYTRQCLLCCAEDHPATCVSIAQLSPIAAEGAVSVYVAQLCAHSGGGSGHGCWARVRWRRSWRVGRGRQQHRWARHGWSVPICR